MHDLTSIPDLSIFPQCLQAQFINRTRSERGSVYQQCNVGDVSRSVENSVGLARAPAPDGEEMGHFLVSETVTLSMFHLWQ